MPRRRTSAKKQRTKKIEKPRPKRERAQPTESNPIAHNQTPKFSQSCARRSKAGLLISDLSGKGGRLYGLGKFQHISRRGRQERVRVHANPALSISAAENSLDVVCDQL